MKIVCTKSSAGPDGAYSAGQVYEVSTETARRLVAEFAAEPYEEVMAAWQAATLAAKPERANAAPGRVSRWFSGVITNGLGA